jgi:hypothetical protein
MAAMRLILACCFLISALFGADDPWTKVKELKSGTEIKITRVGAKEVWVGKMDEANDERVLLVLKNSQMAIDRADVMTLEARPGTGRRVTKESTVKQTDASAELAKPKVPVPGSKPTPQLDSYSSGVGFSSKPGFELIYRKSSK